MKVSLWLVKPITVFTVLITTSLLIFYFFSPPSQQQQPVKAPESMAGRRRRSFVLWLHGLGDSGPANEPIKTFFCSPELRNTTWAFPSAPSNPVSCNRNPLSSPPLPSLGFISCMMFVFNITVKCCIWVLTIIYDAFHFVGFCLFSVLYLLL